MLYCHTDKLFEISVFPVRRFVNTCYRYGLNNNLDFKLKFIHTIVQTKAYFFYFSSFSSFLSLKFLLILDFIHLLEKVCNFFFSIDLHYVVLDFMVWSMKWNFRFFSFSPEYILKKHDSSSSFELRPHSNFFHVKLLTSQSSLKI